MARAGRSFPICPITGRVLRYPQTFTSTTTETITETDTLIELRVTPATLTETITQTVTAIRATVRSLVESVTNTDSIVRTIVRPITETITNTATVIKNTVRTLTEAINNLDIFFEGIAQNTGAVSAGAGSNDSSTGTVVWQNPGNITSSDTAYATATMDATTSQYLKANTFGFAVPTGSTITGIKAEIQKLENSVGGVLDNAVHIVKSNGSIGSMDKSTLVEWPKSEAYSTYGSSNDLWGETWTASDINNSNFGVAISAKATPIGTPFVQTATGTTTNSQTTVTATLTVTAGNVLVVSFHDGTTFSSVSGITDTQGNTYTLRSSNVPSSSHGGTYTTTVASSGSLTITGSTTGAAAFMVLVVQEFTGILETPDKIANATQTTATSLSSGTTATTTYANELLVGSFMWNGSTTTGSTLGSGYSNLGFIKQTNNNTFAAMESQVVSVTGIYSATLTTGSAPTTSSSTILTFQINEPVASVDHVRMTIYYIASGNFYSKVFTEAITSTDALLRSIVHVLTEAITNTDVLLRTVTRAFFETITHIATALNTIVRTLVESITNSDTILTIKGGAAILSESIANSDTFTRIWMTGRIYLETITNTDVFVGSSVRLRNFVESISSIDTVLRSTVKVLADSVTQVDSLVHSIVKTLAESVTNTATFSSVHTFAVTLIESITSSDTFTRVWTIARTFTESIIQSDVLRKLLNGTDVFWQHVSKAASSLWTKAAQTAAMWTPGTRSTNSTFTKSTKSTPPTWTDSGKSTASNWNHDSKS